MAKGYWISFYRSISDPAALAAYAKLAGPAILAHGGRFVTRGNAAKAYEQGLVQRVTVADDRLADADASAIERMGIKIIVAWTGKAAEPPAPTLSQPSICL